MYTAISIAFFAPEVLECCWARCCRLGKTQSVADQLRDGDLRRGSAIAAMGPVLEANEEEIGGLTGHCVCAEFCGVAAVPPDRPLHEFFRETQFGLWSALAIHDTSSVVGVRVRSMEATALAVGNYGEACEGRCGLCR